jgi:hypothetical protein
MEPARRGSCAGPTGRPGLNSFAHGRTTYQLKHHAGTVRAAIDRATDDAVVKIFVKLALAADLTDEEIENLRNEAAKRSGSLSAHQHDAQGGTQERAAKRKQRDRNRRIAERQDPRPAIRVPNDDAPWLPQMDLMNDVIGASAASHPPARDIDGVAALDGQITVPKTHAFTSEGANPED